MHSYEDDEESQKINVTCNKYEYKFTEYPETAEAHISCLNCGGDHTHCSY